ncbi:MAG TPA: PF20097 family protein [Rubricoccaceae bacterium]|nr:PF20097 family protein [Rubricoccaceae bacterium]
MTAPTDDPWYRTCLRCGAEMTEGFLLDEGQSTKNQAVWVDGPPEKSVWGGVKYSKRRKLPLTAYRCVACGFVDLYARENPEGQREAKRK